MGIGITLLESRVRRGASDNNIRFERLVLSVQDAANALGRLLP